MIPMNYISSNTAITAFESGFIKHIGATVINLALVRFFCHVGVQYILMVFLWEKVYFS